jgi:hypothetical protein
MTRPRAAAAVRSCLGFREDPRSAAAFVPLVAKGQCSHRDAAAAVKPPVARRATGRDLKCLHYAK